MENVETLDNLKWNLQHFEKVKYLILQFAKYRRYDHDKNYWLPIGQTLWKCNLNLAS